MGGIAIPSPTFEWLELAPVLIVLIGACLGVLIEAVAPRGLRFVLQLATVALTLVGAFVVLVINWQAGRLGPFAMDSVMLDGPSYVQWACLLVFGLLAFSVFAERRLGNGASVFAGAASSVPGSLEEAEAAEARLEHSEVFPLALFSLAGMMVFLAANDLLTSFVALEVMSLPLYLLSGMARRRRLLSQEAALKYFLLGAFASAFYLFGIALVYGYAGSFQFSAINDAISAPVYSSGLLYTGLVLLAIGLLFKMGAVPFQSWVPDVYVGAPTPVTGFMAICTKLAAVGAMTRVFYVALGAERWSWQPLLAVIAVATMVVGIILAFTQTDIKRLLAYSSVAHAGFLLTAVVGATVDSQGRVTSMGSIMFYLLAYGFATITAFAVVTLVRNSAGEAHSLSSWAGLGRRSPLLGGVVAVVMLSFAGIPLTGGFIGKWAVFSAAWRGGFSWLVIVAIVFSLVAAGFYLRVIVSVFFAEPAEGVQIGQASAFTWVPLLIGAVASIYLGLFPGPVLELIEASSGFLR